MKFERSIEIAAPPQKIWPLIFQPENLLQWHPTAQRFDVVGDQRTGEGATFYMEVKSGARLTRHVYMVTGWQENKKFAFHQILGDLKRHDALWTIEATEKGSRLTVAFDMGLPYWIIGKIMGALFVRKQMEKELEGELANIKRLAEA